MQLSCLPSKTMSLVGPHVLVARMGWPAQLQDPPAATLVSQTLNVAGLPVGGEVFHAINFVSCPLPHCGSVQRPSLKLTGSVKVVVTRPFFGSTDKPA